MYRSMSRLKTSVFLLAVFLFLTSGSRLIAQKVPIDFNDFHGYTGAAQYVKDVAKAYPGITELLEIGKSNMGRPLYVLVITNMNTGVAIDALIPLRNMRKEGVNNVPKMKPYMGKPGHWMDGGTHGNEFTGTEVCLYIIDKLVTGYGNDPEITGLIDKNVFYVCPTVNADGVFNSVERDIPQRQNYMEIDDDEDGMVNEDGPDDINNDGHITNFRYRDPDGRFVIDDIDPRYMVQLGRDETTSKTRYSVVREDIDNDNDGERGEDPERGFDINRNYPEGWFTPEGFRGGTGDYPGSSNETHAIMEFFTNHTNILMAQNFHTSGGFTYRPMGTAPNSVMHPKDIAVYDRVMGKKYLELNSLPVPDAWNVLGPLDTFKEELKNTSTNKHAIERGYEMPDGWISGYNEDEDRVYSYGMVIDWMYMQFGAYSMTTELWNYNRNMKGVPQFSGPDAVHEKERALLKYQDEQFNGEFFVGWKPFKHPQLGDGEVGGWIPKYRGNNAFPGETLVGVAEIHWQFELFKAKLLPDVVISEARARVLYTTNNARESSVTRQGNEITIKKGKSNGKYRIVEVTVTVENKGKLATHLGNGAELDGNREDAVWLTGDRDKMTFLQGTPVTRIGVLEGTMPIPGFEPQREDRRGGRGGRGGRGDRGERGFRGGPPFGSQNPAQMTQPIEGRRRQLTWLIAVEGDFPLRVIVTSQKGGTKVKNITIQ